MGKRVRIVTELGEDLSRVDAPGAREGHDDLADRECCATCVLDARGEAAGAGRRGLGDGDEGADEFALGLASATPASPAGRRCRRSSSSSGGCGDHE